MDASELDERPQTAATRSLRPLRNAFISGEADLNTPYSFEQRLWMAGASQQLIDWAPDNASPLSFRSSSFPFNVALTLNAMGSHRLFSSPWLRTQYDIGWGGAMQWSCPHQWKHIRPSYRFVNCVKIKEGFEGSAMLTLQENFTPSHYDFSGEIPRYGLTSHLRIDNKLIHANTFWTFCRGGSCGTTGTMDLTEQNGRRLVKDAASISKIGLGLTLKKDMASGVNLLVGYAGDIGKDSACVVHADVLRRFCASLRSNFGDLSVGARLRANLITYHDTSLEIGASYRLLSRCRLKGSTSSSGSSIGLAIENVPEAFTSTPSWFKDSFWFPAWFHRFCRSKHCGNFDLTVGVTSSASAGSKMIGFLSVTAR